MHAYAELEAGIRAQPPLIPHALLGALRSDHAGETGAVYIYRGILACSRDPDVTAFAQEHLATEQAHLALMEALVTPAQRSRLLPVWRLAGWLTGALPALVGARAVYRTVEAVETFVDHHYAEQLEQLTADPSHATLQTVLARCRADELQHRDDAGARLGAPGIVGRSWSALVGAGSKWGVALASRI